MDNLENRKGKITIFSTPDVFEQIEKYMLKSGCQSMSFSTYELIKLGLKYYREKIEPREIATQQRFNQTDIPFNSFTELSHPEHGGDN